MHFRSKWIYASAICLILLLSALPSVAADKGKAAAPAGGPVDLNAASQKDLEGLPGIGAATAKKIIQGRPYTSVSDLSKAGVSKKTIEKITPLVTVGAAPAAKPLAPSAGEKAEKKGKKAEAAPPAAAGGPVDLNAASQKDLEALPGVGAATAKKIIASRPYASVSDLSKAGVSKKTLEKITPLVTVGAAPAAKSPAPGTAPATKSPVPPAAPAAKPTAPAAAKAAESAGTAAPAAATPPSKGMVWVNLESKIYHVEGDRYYGKTKKGQWMTEADAVKAGYRKSKQQTK